MWAGTSAGVLHVWSTVTHELLDRLGYVTGFVATEPDQHEGGIDCMGAVSFRMTFAPFSLSRPSMEGSISYYPRVWRQLYACDLRICLHEGGVTLSMTDGFSRSKGMLVIRRYTMARSDEVTSI